MKSNTLKECRCKHCSSGTPIRNFIVAILAIGAVIVTLGLIAAAGV